MRSSSCRKGSENVAAPSWCVEKARKDRDIRILGQELDKVATRTEPKKIPMRGKEKVRERPEVTSCDRQQVGGRKPEKKN